MYERPLTNELTHEVTSPLFDSDSEYDDSDAVLSETEHNV
jgi:hypothetical protein